MSANDGDDFVRREIDWIRVPLREQRPFLGLCLGAQMLAKCLGAPVRAHPEGRAEIGYYRCCRPRPGGTSPARSASPGRPTSTTGTGGVLLPGRADTLATGDDFPTQAIRVGPAAFGLQFHPEVTHAMICRWTVRAAERLRLPGAQDRARQIEGRFMHDGRVAAWLDAFLDHWLSGPSRAAA